MVTATAIIAATETIRPTDKDIQDFVKACRWYQMALNQIALKPDSQKYASIGAYQKGMVDACDFELSNASGSASVSLIEQRKKERIASEKAQKEFAMRKR